MKISNVNKESVIRALYMMLTISLTLILIDLYVPIKMWISGDTLSIDEILQYVKFKHYFPMVLAIGVVYSITSRKKIKKENLNKRV